MAQIWRVKDFAPMACKTALLSWAKRHEELQRKGGEEKREEREEKRRRRGEKRKGRKKSTRPLQSPIATSDWTMTSLP